MNCPYCDGSDVVKTRLLRGREYIVAGALVLIPFAPGVVYYWDRARRLYCRTCKRRLPVRADEKQSES